MPTLEFFSGDILFRRLAPEQAVDFLCNAGAYSGNAGLPEVSVNLSRLTTPERTLRDRPRFGLGELRYGDVVNSGFTVEWDPVEGNEAHCLIRGEATKSNSRLLARLTTVVKMPEPRDH